MKAIILAAGFGNRMRPLTDSKHKTLLEVGGNTIIGNILESLLRNGVTDVVVATGYRDQELRTYLDAEYGESIELSYVHNERYRETNNIYTLAKVFNDIEIDQDILIIESDLILAPQILTSLIESRHHNVALVDKYRSGMDGTVVRLTGDVITEVIPPHIQGENFDFSDKYKTLNIYKFSQAYCEEKFKKLLTFYAGAFDDNCYYELILGVLIYMKQELIHAVCVEGQQWAEVDDPNDMRIAEFVFNPESRKTILNSSHGGYWNYDVLDFCFIRNMYFPPKSMFSEMRNALVGLVHNYGSSNRIVNRKLAYVLLCKEERLVALSGASQIFPWLRATLSGKRGLIPAPSFGEYLGIFKKYDTYADSGAFSWSEIEEKSIDVEVVVFVNPNNPTGTCLPSADIYAFAERHPAKLVIVDESFIDFAGGTSVMERLEQSHLDNILIIKSLSKIYGVPGIRLGFAYSCNAAMRDALAAWLPVWNFNSVAEYMLEIMLKHRKGLENSIAQTIVDRDALAEELRRLPIVERVFDSKANFILVKLYGRSERAEELVSRLLDDNGIFVKDISAKFSDGGAYLRFAVRSPEDNELLLSALSPIAS